MLLYTSGTTAMPKGCVLSHAALVRPAYAMRDRFALTDEDRMWDALPLFHLASLLPLHACMLAGASYVAMRRFDPAAAYFGSAISIQPQRAGAFLWPACVFEADCIECFTGTRTSPPAGAATGAPAPACAYISSVPCAWTASVSAQHPPT